MATKQIQSETISGNRRQPGVASRSFGPPLSRFAVRLLVALAVSGLGTKPILGQTITPAFSPTQYEADLELLDELWPAARKLNRLNDAFTVDVLIGDRSLSIPTHLFGCDPNVIPYGDRDPSFDADRQVIARGDSVLAQYFPPGSLGFAVRHHCPSHRLLDSGQGNDLRDFLKFQDTHAMALVGVQRDGQAGVITINNPQGYQGGRFGDFERAYTAIFFRPRYPEYLNAAQAAAFEANIRTMLIGFNAVSDFPFDDYDGGDPLSARNPATVIAHTLMMIKAISGDSKARSFFQRPANRIYCAELLQVSASAGLTLPLNARTFEPLVGSETWKNFCQAITDHNAGRKSLFTQLNANSLVRHVGLTLAPDDLTPCWKYAPLDLRRTEAERLAFQPMTMADLLEHFLQTYLPREEFGESLANAQAELLREVKPGLFRAMAFGQEAGHSAEQQTAEVIFSELVAVLETPYSNYQEFRAALEPVLAKARGAAGPRSLSGQGLFVPPHLLHLVAQGKQTGGLLRLDYVGHGLPFGVVRAKK